MPSEPVTTEMVEKLRRGALKSRCAAIAPSKGPRKMTANLEQRARELLAAEGIIDGFQAGYDQPISVLVNPAAILRVITTAIKGQPASPGGGIETALLAVVDAVRDYLPPDGIDAPTFINRVIGAVDNPEINPIIRELEHVSANQL